MNDLHKCSDWTFAYIEEKCKKIELKQEKKAERKTGVE